MDDGGHTLRLDLVALGQSEEGSEEVVMVHVGHVVMRRGYGEKGIISRLLFNGC